MRAIVHDIYGSADVARLDDVPVPVPGPGDVLVRVRAASLNAIDLDYLHGRPAFARLGTGLLRPRLRTLGVDAAGEVEAVGAGVTDLRPGDRVLGDLSTHAHGAFAELACAPERAWIRLAETIAFPDAATVPHAALLAYQGLAGRGHGVRPGDHVLVDGASGNVGPWAVQLAKAWGAEVTGVCSTAKMDFVRSIGADDVIDYTRDDVTRLGRRWDLILDMTGSHPIAEMRRALARDGRYVMLGGSTPRILGALVVGPVIGLASDKRANLMLWWKPGDPTDLAAVCDLMEAGRIRPSIDRTFPLEEGQAALRYLDERRARGKVVLLP
jgi:NADPH:quinone reductase-like Zn-dependent oxidoreductase